MPNIKDLLGEAYVEGMSAEDQIKALESISLPQDRTDEIDRLIKAKDKANSEAAEYKRKLKDHMSEEEKRNTEEAERIQKIEQENADLKKRIAIADYTSKFLASGLDAETAAKSAEAAYTGDIDTVIANYNSRIASVKESVKAELIASTPSMQGGKTGKVKDYTQDINDSIVGGDMAKAAALMRVAQEQTMNE
jgi:hypothetical protein